MLFRIILSNFFDFKFNKSILNTFGNLNLNSVKNAINKKSFEVLN